MYLSGKELKVLIYELSLQQIKAVLENDKDSRLSQAEISGIMHLATAIVHTIHDMEAKEAEV
jgi:hypothetical protein